jgi:hypothetical protein
MLFGNSYGQADLIRLKDDEAALQIGQRLGRGRS